MIRFAWLILIVVVALVASPRMSAVAQTQPQKSSSPKQESPSQSAAPVTGASPHYRYNERGVGEPFNPARCKTGKKGYVYWAARDQVFQFHYDPTQPVYPRSGNPYFMGKADNPPPLVPSEPEGCYGNPLRGGGVPYMDNYAAELFRKLAGREMDTSTGLVWTRGYFAVPERRLSDNKNELHKKWFYEKDHCWKRPSDIAECMKGNNADPNDYRISRTLKIDAVLVFPSGKGGQDIYVSILGDHDKRRGYAIESGFDLYNSVRLLDNFRVFPNEIDLLVPYYRGLIRYVMAAHVPGYQWTLPKTQ